MFCIFYHYWEERLGNFTTIESWRERQLNVLQYLVLLLMRFRKPSILPFSCPLLYDKAHLQFAYFSWKVRKVFCYPSLPCWRQMVHPNIQCPLLFLGSQLMAFPNACTPLGDRGGCSFFAPLLTKCRGSQRLRRRWNHEKEGAWIPKWLRGTSLQSAWDWDRNENKLVT